MNVFYHHNYREVISSEVQARKKKDGKYTFQTLCEATGIQKTYLSKVINEKAHLNTDQIHLIGQSFGFSKEERRFFSLLLECERTSLEDRKLELQEEIDQLRSQNLGGIQYSAAMMVEDGNVKAQKAFSSHWSNLIHAAVGVPRFSKQPELLIKELGIRKDQLEVQLENLEEAGYLKQDEQGRWHATHPLLSVEGNSLAGRVTAQGLRLASIHRLNASPKAGDRSSTLTFSTSKAVFNSLQQKIEVFLREIEEEVEDSDAEEIYQCNIDLFGWMS